MGSYRQSDYYALKEAALLENNIHTQGYGEWMTVDINGERRFFGHRKGEVCLTWKEGYDPKTEFECCCREKVGEKYSSYADCPTDLIISVIAGYIEYDDLRKAFSNVILKIN